MTVNIRTLKDKLSSYLRQVQRGDVVLVTDRGVVIAELRQPSLRPEAASASQERRQRLVDEGTLTLGLPNRPNIYSPAPLRLAAKRIDEALATVRGD